MEKMDWDENEHGEQNVEMPKTKMSFWVKLLTVIPVAVVAVVGVTIGLIAIWNTTLMVIAITGSFLTILYLSKSFGIMPPEKFGVRVVLGKPGKTVNSDWYFALWPFVKVVKITKQLMMFRFTVKTAVTGRGKIKGYEKIVEPIEADIECTIYAQFDEKKASHIVQYAPGYTAKSLGPFLVPYAIDAVRALAGRLPWRLINRERYKSAVWVQARLTGGSYYGIKDDEINDEICFKDDPGEEQSNITVEQLEGKSPFVTLHMKNVSFAIEDFKFTEAVMTSVVAPEKAKLDGEAKVITAEAEKIKKVKEGEGDAEARGAMLNKIKVDKELESLSALKEIGKGPGNFIFALPGSLQKLLEKVGEDKK